MAELRSHLYDTLPHYMVPTYFTALDVFPYTPNGKIDKNALPIPNGILKTEENHENIKQEFTSLQNEIIASNGSASVYADEVFSKMAERKKEERISVIKQSKFPSYPLGVYDTHQINTKADFSREIKRL